MKMTGKYFYGHEISSYGIENGYVDYATLASAFDAVLNNDIMNKTWGFGEWEQLSGFPEDEEDDYIPDVFQWYIVSEQGADILEECNEIVYYHNELDIYLWGVTHFGTSWSYVLTSIPCNTECNHE